MTTFFFSFFLSLSLSTSFLYFRFFLQHTHTKKKHQVDADALRVGLSDGSAELREVLLDAEALDDMLVSFDFF